MEKIDFPRGRAVQILKHSLKLTRSLHRSIPVSLSSTSPLNTINVSCHQFRRIRFPIQQPSKLAPSATPPLSSLPPLNLFLSSMTKVKEESRLVLGFFWNRADAKLLLASVFFLCSFLTLFQFIPSLSIFSVSSLSSLLIPSPPREATTPPSSPIPSSSPQSRPEKPLPSGFIRRSFSAIGSAAYLFVQMGAYRGSTNSFAVVGLSSKPLHVFGKPQFRCEWHPLSSPPIPSSLSYKLLPDWGYGRVYTVVVVNCTFSSAVGADGSGGRLLLFASPSAAGPEEPILALSESPNQFNASALSAPPKYDYLYCGSPLFGNLSPQRIREWVAYHARLFGSRGHIVFHDAGGVQGGVMEVLEPWIEKGLVTLQDVREQEQFDGYYHNQFLVVNDCLHRYRLAAKWIFFFDVDEFLYLDPKTKLDSFLESMKDYSQFTFEQVPMSSNLCRSADAGNIARMWGFEKLVYRDVKRGVRRNRKYAVQPRRAFSAGVHMSQNIDGKTLHSTNRRMTYFHYHDTIAKHREACRQFANATQLTVEGTPFVLDVTLRRIAGQVKRFELTAIGPRLSRTIQ